MGAAQRENFDELPRVVESLQLTANYSVSTPTEGKNGEDVNILGGVSDEDAKTASERDSSRRRPYLRVTPQPNLDEPISST